MKKTILDLFVLALVLASSCKKSTITTNSWTFKGTVYSVWSSSSPVPAAISYTSTNPVGNIRLTFGTISVPAAGSYQVTDSIFPALTQVRIVLTNSSGTTYSSTGSSHKNVVVSISASGEITCELPSGGAMLYSGVGNDSAAVTGTLTEP